MEIQSDLITLPSDNHLPLPWSVRGPLGLETGSVVSLALVKSASEHRQMPDIIVTPLQTRWLHKTFTLEVELGERPGAVADFLSWFGSAAADITNNNVNIVLSETITLEGGQRHKLHLVIEPVHSQDLQKDVLYSITKKIRASHSRDIKSVRLFPTYSDKIPPYDLEKKVRVDNGWLKYDGWMTKIQEKYGDYVLQYDVGKVVVSSSPEQRLLRYIIPRRGVIELRVPHLNEPGALREISDAIKGSGYNILSSRLSRTPPSPDISPDTSVFVAACEPLADATTEDLLERLSNIDTSFMIDGVTTSRGRSALRSLYLTPRRTERVEINTETALRKEKLRAELAEAFFQKYKTSPLKYVFLSRRFVSTIDFPDVAREQERCRLKIVAALEGERCAVIEAADPSDVSDLELNDYVDKAVFPRLWASDACLILALYDDSSGKLSLSMAHEIGFFTGRNRPYKVLVSSRRDEDPIFGNTVGKNRLVYADGETAFVDEEKMSIDFLVRAWARAISQTQ